jgi:hypothetical protein
VNVSHVSVLKVSVPPSRLVGVANKDLVIQGPFYAAAALAV